MGPKRVNKLKVAPTGRISVVPEVCETSEVTETPGIAAKDTETLTVKNKKWEEKDTNKKDTKEKDNKDQIQNQRTC